MDALRVGQHALLVECSGSAEVAATYALLRSRSALLEAEEIVPAARTVLLDGLRDVEQALAVLASLARPVEGEAPGQVPDLVELPTRYDGPDLDEVARQWRCSVEEVVRRHQETLFVVAFCGFAPGFAYCTGLPPDLSVSRREEPRSRVPAGSVGLAGEFTGVYPTASPGGWQLIGSTASTVWRPEETSPALLVPGTHVRFVDA